MIYPTILQNAEARKKQLAILIDPDKASTKQAESVARTAEDSGVSFFFVGGSLLTCNRLEVCIQVLKKNCAIPVVLFPGSVLQVHKGADAILFLSLISGRNAEMLIGRHVIAAPYVKEAGLEVIPTGYMIIDSGRSTAALYMSNSIPIPSDKDDIAYSTAMAGEMLGLKMIYMDAGSGAENAVRPEMIRRVKEGISIPLIVGGGIRTAQKAFEIFSNGADLIVVGNAVEKDHSLITELAGVIKQK